VRVCGLAAVAALFGRDPERVERLFFEPRLRAASRGFCVYLAGARKPYREVAAAELARVAGTVRHGGITAIARPQPPVVFDASAAADWARDGQPIVVLDGISNPHNLGAIVRTAAFFGIERLLLADRPEQAYPSGAAYRVAEGGFDHLTVYRAALPKALPRLREFYRIVAAVPVDGGADLHDLSRARPTAFILGNEETGIDPASLAQCDAAVTIPGSGKVQSLNVAAAAAILMYALTRG
jgi:RNA methyltransferase, TrmH family